MRSSSLLLALISCSVILMIQVECRVSKVQSFLSSKSQAQNTPNSAVEYKLDFDSQALNISQVYGQDVPLTTAFDNLPQKENRFLIFSLDNELYLLSWEPNGASAEEKVAYAQRLIVFQNNQSGVKYVHHSSYKRLLTERNIKNHSKKI